ncbi:hypothetical protein BU25DRAFT_474997 [Macroventuria anomochaeta]|uniref:Uncharacterized protein n=1 Tax=Macroventuria anomochaeta TaxID=301207 RepID=A0ACB6SCB2_9PLEO|nr:uncharacterized protein BU25DRAFT_474997 [Macroventuria anomochaeta]KAF2631935.1 hypothetical protein BU25DRAFT_474997 [Macroventuria anomochaeta]
MVRFQGCIPSPEDIRDHEASIDKLKGLSKGLCLPAFDIYKNTSAFAEKLPFTPHIYNQGDINSTDTARVPGSGSMNRDVLKAILALGCCAEAASLSILKHESNGTWPYIEIGSKEDEWPHCMKVRNTPSAYAKPEDAKSEGHPPLFQDGALCRLPPDVKCFAEATRHRTLPYAHPKPIDDVNCWKALIQVGYPIVFAIDLYSNFDHTASSSDYGFIVAVPYLNMSEHEGHVIMAVGWDDSKGNGGAFRVHNSWGDDLASRGFY